MNPLNELRLYLYNKYLKKNFTVSDIEIMSRIMFETKREHIFIDYLIIKCLIKSLKYYDVLGVFNPNDKYYIRSLKLTKVLEKYYCKPQKSHLETFKKDYQFNFEELEILCIQMTSNYVSEKEFIN